MREKLPPGTRSVSSNHRAGRLAAVALVAVASIALAPAFIGERPADAATTSQGFTVSASVVTGCAFLVQDLTFANYVRGTTFNDDAASSFAVFCASATAGKPVPVTYTINAVGGFKMANGASLLNYELCWDSGCTAQIPNGSGTGILVDRATYTAPYYGRIFANQAVPTGPYRQTVNVTLAY